MKNNRYENTATFVFVYSPTVQSEDSNSPSHFEKVVSYTQDELVTPPRKISYKETDVVLKCEDRGQFEKMAERLKSELLPSGPHEEFLVSQMIAAQWRLQRLDRIEHAMHRALDGTEQAFPDKSKITSFTRIERYRKSLERTYRRSANELRAGRKRQSR